MRTTSTERRARVRRYRRRSIAAAATVAVGSMAIAGVAGATPITVACGGAGGGAAGLVHAIDQANATAGPDSIDLDAGCTYVLTVAASTDTGLPVVTGQLTIRGHGATIKRSPSSSPFRILEVSAGAALSLDNVVLTGGAVSLSGALALGGGILNSGLLTVTESKITDNEVRGSGSSAGGGGIANNGTMVLRDTALRDNRASATGTQIFAAVGGALLNRMGATMSIAGSTVAGNWAEVRGDAQLFSIAAAGGIGNSGTLTLSDTRIVGNWSAAMGVGGQANGGGMSVADGTVRVTGGTLQENSAWAVGERAAAHGGGLENSGRTRLAGTAVTRNRASGPTAQGGGLYNGRHRLRIVNSTVTENVATATSGPGQGGGIFVDAGQVDLSATGVSANQPDDCEPALPGC